MVSIGDADKKRNEERLLQNYSKLKLGEIYDGEPKTATLNYHEIDPNESDFEMDFKVQNNHLIVDL